MDNFMNKMIFTTELHRVLLAVLLLMLLPVQQVYADGEAGKVIYTHGKVWASDSDGKGRNLKKGDKVFSGDTIATKSKAMVHLRMLDKGYISIRSNSQFKIEQFKLGKNKDQDKGIFALLRGGFRAVTGIIGKRVRSSYRVKTGVATIGIRGTDYTARLCNDDCGSSAGVAGSRAGFIENGLYVGVLDGGVTLQNQLGALELERLHYGFVKDAASAPRALLNAPKFLFFKTRAPKLRDDDEKSESSNDSSITSRSVVAPESGDALSEERQNSDIGEVDGYVSESDIDSQTTFVLETTDGSSLDNPTEQAAQAVAMGAGPLGTANSFTDVTSNFPSSLGLDSDGFVESFSAENPAAGVVQYEIGTAQNVDLGLDANTGIRWGRWAGGTAKVNDQDLDLNESSLHWVAGPTNLDNNITLPTSGSISYNLVGGTSPTDNFGNAGFISGSSTLNANFDAMTVDSSINLSIPDTGQLWTGTSSGLPINASGQYGGAMDTVNVEDGAGTSFTGSGGTSGFFTNNATGSGMTYSMDSNIGGAPTSVSGSAVFEQK